MCVCTGGRGLVVGVQGAVEPCALSEKVEKRKLAQSGKLGARIRAETGVADVRGEKGSLHPTNRCFPSGLSPWREEVEPRQSSRRIIVRPYRCSLTWEAGVGIT